MQNKKSRRWSTIIGLLAVVGLIIFFVVQKKNVQATEYIQNGNFSTGDLTNWTKVETTGNTVSVVQDSGNYVAKLDMTQLDANPQNWHITLYQKNSGLNTIPANTQFILTYRAKASVSRTVLPSFIDDTPFTQLGLQGYVHLTTSWQTFTQTFKTPNSMPSSDVALYFQGGTELGTIYLDDISLQPMTTLTYSGSNTQIGSFDSGEVWTGIRDANYANQFPPDATHVYEGDKAMKLSASASGRDAVERIMRADLSASGWQVRLHIYAENPENIGRLNLAFRSAAPSTLRWDWVGITGLQSGWNTVVLTKSRFWGWTFGGRDIDWTDVWAVGMRLENNDNGSANVWVDDLRIEPTTTDETAPDLLWVAVKPITSTAATFTWETDENATSRIDCGSSTSYGLTATDASLVTNHSISLSHLTPNSEYHCQMTTADSSGNTNRTGDFIFRTEPLLPPALQNENSPFYVELFGMHGWDMTGYFNVDWVNRFTRTSRANLYWEASLTWLSDAQLTQYLDAISPYGIKVLMALDLTPVINSDDTSQITADINHFKDRPEILGWYVTDEPEIYPEQTVAKVTLAYNAAKAADPSRQVYLGTSNLAAGYSYLSTFDHAEIFPYPVASSSPLDTGLANAVASGKPFRYISQGYENSYLYLWPTDGTAWDRFPTFNEMRTMSYLGALHGAEGVAFYAEWEAHVAPGRFSEWMKISTIINEFRDMAPIYGSTDTPEITFTSVSNNQLDVGVKQYRGKVYVTVANKENTTVSNATVNFSGNTISSIKNIWSQTSPSNTSTSFTDTWTGHDTHVYEIVLGTRTSHCPAGQW